MIALAKDIILGRAVRTRALFMNKTVHAQMATRMVAKSVAICVYSAIPSSATGSGGFSRFCSCELRVRSREPCQHSIGQLGIHPCTPLRPFRDRLPSRSTRDGWIPIQSKMTVQAASQDP